MKLLEFDQFVAENTQGHLHHEFQDDVTKVKKDFSTDKQDLDDSDLKVGDYATHKHKQSLGIGQIKKLHPSSHATLHFARDLESSLEDAASDHEEFVFHLADLIPIVGTQS